jgi:hypothetical protein
MVSDITCGMDEPQKEALLSGVRGVNDFFKKEVSSY